MEFQVPVNIQSLLIDAYFGHMWNLVLLQRLNVIGSQPQIGDVYCSPNFSKFLVINDEGTRISIRPCRIAMPLTGSLADKHGTICSMYFDFLPEFDLNSFVLGVR